MHRGVIKLVARLGDSDVPVLGRWFSAHRLAF
jgi:hypothetical protein